LFVTKRSNYLTMKKVLTAVLWIVSILLGYLIYQSIMAPIEFNKTREERFTAVIERLKEIKVAQEAYKTVNGKYAGDFEGLVQFIDTAEFTITQQRDSSFMRYNRVYRIDMQVDTVVIDTLGRVSIKDSLFKNSMSYKELMNVPYGQNGETFELKAEIITKGNFQVPVFMASVKKDVVLYDQPEDLRLKENTHNSIEEVNGNQIVVGSLTEVSTSGNWPSIYDKK
jgi:type II secretory pathway pseudopilin PulG